jgi:hypothetical protein
MRRKVAMGRQEIMPGSTPELAHPKHSTTSLSWSVMRRKWPRIPGSGCRGTIGKPLSRPRLQLPPPLDHRPPPASAFAVAEKIFHACRKDTKHFVTPCARRWGTPTHVGESRANPHSASRSYYRTPLTRGSRRRPLLYQILPISDTGMLTKAERELGVWPSFAAFVGGRRPRRGRSWICINRSISHHPVA